MTGIKHLIHEVVPLRYDLSFSNLTIHVHLLSSVFKAIQSLLTARGESLNYVNSYSGYPQIAPWVPPPDKPGAFGYGAVGSYSDEQDGMITCSVALPQVHNPINEAATLKAMFELVWILDVVEAKWEQTTRLKQLVSIDIMSINVDGRSHMAALQVDVGKQLLDWIMGIYCTDRTQQQITQAMRTAYVHMSQAFFDEATAKEMASDCRFYILGDRRPCFIAPGDACDLAPEGMDEMYAEYGCELGPHNIDGHIQQLTLLVGVAKLCELARKSISQVRAP